MKKMANIFRPLSCLAGLLVFCGSVPPRAAAQESLQKPPVIVVGFVGGYIRHDDPVRGGVQMAARLRADYPATAHAQVFENHRGEEAHQQILQLLDANRNGKLSPEEKANARIIVYGVSWGGSETVNLAGELAKDGIPVLLTIQIDSVAKIGQDDSIIPANVAEAANFYQTSGLLHGRKEIRAADPARTRILGNFQMDYKTSSLKCEDYPLRQRVLFRTHVLIECDPILWKQVESLIRPKLRGSSSDAKSD